LEFLGASGRVFAKLKRGSKVSTRSSDRYEEKLRQRREDPLLRYLLHARNAREHSIEEITEKYETKTTCLKPKERVAAAMERGLIGSPIAPLEMVDVTPAHVRLLEVVDWGTCYSPPSQHHGIALTDTSPANIAELGLAYLNLMLKEASGLTS
jgi:hypothetical protein